MNINLETLGHEQSCKSHSPEEIRQGLESGQEIWLFDSGVSGNDDTLLYPPGTSSTEVRADLEDFYFLQDGEPVPADLWDRDAINPWTLEGPISATDAARRWPLLETTARDGTTGEQPMVNFAFISRHRPTPEQCELARDHGITLVSVGDTDAFTLDEDFVEEASEYFDITFKGAVVVHPAAALRLAPRFLIGVFENETRPPVDGKPQFKAKALHIYDRRTPAVE